MKSSLNRVQLSVKKSLIHGYGVFAEQNIPAGEIIEECHALVSKERVMDLNDYYFQFKERYMLPLGYGCIYNHSAKPNAYSIWHNEDNLMLVIAKQNIFKGEEICISYGEDYFSFRNIKVKSETWRMKWRRLFPLLMTVMRFLVIVGGIYYLLRLS